MTPEQLKASILQYAFQGKLVEQRPEEGTAEELVSMLLQSKAELEQKKVDIKKAPTEPFYTAEDLKEWDIPDTWRWVQLSDVSVIQEGAGIRKWQYRDSGTQILCVTNILEGAIDVGKKELYISTEEYEEKYLHLTLNAGDIVTSCSGGSWGKIAFYNVPKTMMLNTSTLRMRFFKDLADNSYLYYVCKSQFFKRQLLLQLSGMQPNFGYAHYSRIMFPLPPVEEQKRIVAKIEELLPYVDRYAVAYERLEQFNAKFPEDMKKSILQYAIQGKLVEQRSEEGTGEELYQQIQAKKQRLVKEGKVKKEKPLPEITEGEVPFDIPESWKWVHVGEIFSHNTGKAMNSSAKKVDKPGTIRPFITTSNVYWNTFDFSSVKEMFFSDDEVERCTITKGDILMCEGGAYFGRTAIWNLDYDICFQNHVHRLRPYQKIDLMFFYHIFFFYKNMNMIKAKGTAMPGLSSITLHQMVIPLPPLNEQKRIVAKLEELLPLCERLKK